ncbi:MAG: ATP-dependent sacrificial sulfur transferase LarE [Candidatus Thorarchaeota archaeon]
MEDATRRKFEAIRPIVEEKGVLVAFSGGVDSSVLARVVKDYTSRVILLTISSQTISAEEFQKAEQVAKELGLKHEILEVDWLSIGKIADNPKDRCYLCKKQLSRMWKQHAQSLGLDIVVEGTNASDSDGFRPGAKALEEEGIISPFLIIGITKPEIREYARENGLSIADRPSMACLATRFPYGTKITEDMLSRIEHLEKGVVALLKIRTIRVRHHGNLVRIEVGRNEREQIFNTEILDQLQKLGKSCGYEYVTFDVYGYRTGAMDESSS